MSRKESSTWTCDYCDRSETFPNTDYSQSGWLKGQLVWNEHYFLSVHFCRECFKAIFPNSGGIDAPAGTFKKPFWKRLFTGAPDAK